MRPIDELLRLYRQSDSRVQRYALARMENLKVTFEAAELIDFVETAVHSDDSHISVQANRTMRRSLPMYYGQKYHLRQATSTTKAGTWTEYNIDRSELEKLKRLGKAQTINFDKVDVARMVASATHILTPAIEATASLALTGAPEIRKLAIRALGQLKAKQALDALVSLISEQDLVLEVAAALGEQATPRALDALLQTADRYKGTQYFEEVLIELRNFSLPESYQALNKELVGAPPTVKASIALALQGFKTFGAETQLVQLLSDTEPYVLLYAIDSLARVGGSSCISPIGRVYQSSKNSLVRRAAIRTLGAIGKIEAREIVTEAMHDSEPEIRAQALESMVRLHVPDQELFETVFPLVQDSHPVVASNAILALSPIDSSMALQRIFTFLRQSDEYARAQGVYCLGYIQNTTAFDILDQIIGRDNSELVAVQATKALSKYKAEDSVPVLLRLLEHRLTAVRKVAARLLGHVGTKGNLSIFKRVSQLVEVEQEADVKLALVDALSNVAEPAQHLRLAKYLDSRDPDVTAAVIEGLDLLGNIDSVAEVEGYLQSPNPKIKARAALALWNQGEMKVVEKLTQDLEERKEEQVRGALCAVYEIGLSLRRLSDAAKYPLLLSELKDNLDSDKFEDFEKNHTQRLMAIKPNKMTDDSRTFEFESTVCVEDLSIDLGLPPIGSPTEEEETIDTSALDKLLETSQVAPGDAPFEVQLEKVLTLQMNRKIEEAQKAAETLVEETDEPAARFLLAKILLNEKKGDEAEAQLKALAERDSTFVNPLLVLTGLCQKRKAKSEMVTHYSNAVERCLTLLKEQLDMTKELLRKGDMELLPLFVRELRQQLPAMESLHKRTGILHLSAGDYNAAFRELLLAHICDPLDGDVSIKLARAAARSGRKSYARNICRTILASPHATDLVREKVQEILEKL